MLLTPDTHKQFNRGAVFPSLKKIFNLTTKLGKQHLRTSMQISLWGGRGAKTQIGHKNLKVSDKVRVQTFAARHSMRRTKRRLHQLTGCNKSAKMLLRRKCKYMQAHIHTHTH